MNNRSLADYDKFKFRSIIYHGKNSMTDMGLMMIGSTPLSQVTPKTVREEIAYADGDLDLSRVDGKIYFNEREITYTFISIEDYAIATQGYPTVKNRIVNNTVNDIYDWLYDQEVSTAIWRHDLTNDVEPGSPLDEQLGVLSQNELYDYAYGLYKFMRVGIPEVQIAKAIFHSVWIEQINITFRFQPYLQTFVGERIELATIVDRALTSRNTQAMITIFTNNRYYTNDSLVWLNDGSYITSESTPFWRFKIRIPYSGVIGMYIAPDPSMNEVTYEIDTVSGLTFLDNSHPGETLNQHKGGYGYVTPVEDSDGYKYVTLDVYFTDTWTTSNPPWIYVEWGIIRNFSVPDQDHYIVDAHTKSNTATMYINATETDFSQAFALPEQPLNEIHIRNEEYDGLYKLRYDSTSRRL